MLSKDVFWESLIGNIAYFFVIPTSLPHIKITGANLIMNSLDYTHVTGATYGIMYLAYSKEICVNWSPPLLLSGYLYYIAISLVIQYPQIENENLLGCVSTGQAFRHTVMLNEYGPLTW